ncbi:hypothetical protein N9N67_01430 [Bacteriovoracaceae bacterium]|nr:hypothetical protein [Bacteriovoracaceae bacterium]
MKQINMLLAALILISLPALSFNQSYDKSGSKFTLIFKDNIKSDLSIYIAGIEGNMVGVEMFFHEKSFSNTRMSQQFWIDKSSSKLEIKEGYFLVPEFKSPQKLTKEYFNVNSGVKIEDFLFADESSVKENSKGKVTLTVAGMDIPCEKFEKSRGKQKITYYISPMAKPIGLVKLISEGEEEQHNYVIEFNHLIKNISPKIDRKIATEMTEEGKSFLPKPK